MIYFAMELANRINRDHPSDVNGCHGAKKNVSGGFGKLQTWVSNVGVIYFYGLWW